MQIGIIIPIYHNNELHADFTRQTLESIQSQEHELVVYVINNYCLPQFKIDSRNYSPLNLKILDNPKGNHVGAAWNYGIKKSLEAGCDYIIVANNDIIFHVKAIDNLVKFAQAHSEFIMWTASEWDNLRTIRSIKDEESGDSYDEHPHFSCFMVNQKTIDVVGWFDENLKTAYHEDGDYHYRIILSGNKAAKTLVARFYHYGSRTIKVDEEINRKNVRTYEANREYIRQKWNTDFHDKAYDPPEKILEEPGIYKHPFNDVNKSIKDW